MNKLTAICLGILMLSFSVQAQRNLTPGKPSLEDRFPRKSGSMLFSALSISYPNMLDDQAATDSLRFYNNGSKPISLAITNVAPHLTATLSTAMLAPGAEGFLKVKFDAAKKNDYGFIVDQVTLETSDDVLPDKFIIISTDIMPRAKPMTKEDSLNAPVLQVLDSLVDFGKVKEGDPNQKSFHIRNNGKSDLRLLAVKTSCGCISGQASKMALTPGETTEVNASIHTEGKNGVYYYEIMLYSNDPYSAKKEVPLKIEVSK